MELLHSHELVAGTYEWALATPDIQRWLLDRYLENKKQKAREQKDNGQHAQ